ncbi:hypothetical protein [Bacillus sp. 2205SS5-2]
MKKILLLLTTILMIGTFLFGEGLKTNDTPQNYSDEVWPRQTEII